MEEEQQRKSKKKPLTLKGVQKYIASLEAKQRRLGSEIMDFEDETRELESRRHSYLEAIRTSEAEPLRDQRLVDDALDAFEPTQVRLTPASSPLAEADNAEAGEAETAEAEAAEAEASDAEVGDAEASDAEADDAEAEEQGEDTLFIPEDPRPLQSTVQGQVQDSVAAPARKKRRVTFAEEEAIVINAANSDHGSLDDDEQKPSSTSRSGLEASTADPDADGAQSTDDSDTRPRKRPRPEPDAVDTTSPRNDKPTKGKGKQPATTENSFNEYNTRLPVASSIQPIGQKEYEAMQAEVEELGRQQPCPYPGCENLYKNNQTIERHLRRDHPDWIFVQDEMEREDGEGSGEGEDDAGY